MKHTKQELLDKVEKVFKLYTHCDWYEKMLENIPDNPSAWVIPIVMKQSHACEILAWLFPWSETPEGQGLNYWREKYNILALLRDVENHED